MSMLAEIMLPPGVGGCRATDRSTDSINRLLPGRLSQVQA